MWCHKSLAKGAAGAHAFLRKANEPHQIHVTFNDRRGNGSDPCTALSLRSEAWKKHWTKHGNDGRTDQLATAFKQAREKAVIFQDIDGHSSLTARQVTAALRAMKSGRACGLDHWTPGNWLNLSLEARQGIASILSECEKGLVWPHQAMQNAVALLGKSATDDRPISLTSLLYAVYVKIKKPVIADFDRAHATVWDSCLREGIKRRFASEVACLNGKHCVDTFLDLEKFYDSIDNVKLIQQAFQLKWNPVVLYMSLLVHMAPRVLRIGDLWGEWISPCNCILHGCGSSNSWARALLYRLVQNLHSHFRVQIGQQVDDINHNSQGTFFQALHWSVEATCMLDRGLTSLGLTISHNKSMVVASHPQLLPLFGVSCWSKEFLLKEQTRRDVGLDANAGNKRTVKIQNKREQKCRKRNAHIKVIQKGLKTKHQAMKLFKTGILPAASYGHAAMGVCPSSIQHKRAMAADSCGKRIETACTTTILHFHFGENGDPAIWFPLDQLRTWLELQGDEMGHRLGKIDVARAWAAASANMKKTSRWSMVKGPMTATMATLHDPSIIPAFPWKWYPPENPDVGWTLSGGDPGPFLNEMKQRLFHTRFGNRLHCTITVSVRKMVST